ncbi:3-dehydroquinate synthase [Bacillus thermophilus]|uniref:3-dehydroquinate synthase n=2 Tax=Bacillaceae TaxID=186817 RepID=A0ABS2R395_9BACI|nr:3-dehydroquinate synthase [Siminovitchia thermophila]
MKMIVRTASKSYPVFIGPASLDELGDLVVQNNYTKLLVITDEIVGSLHLDTLKANMPQEIPSVVYTVPAGEKAKQLTVFEACITHALEHGLDRKSCIIAFGGGAVGDLAGFVAAAYMRGISFIQVPTTILAHDSAVGGKTAINHRLGKNMIGAFHQPDAVLYNTYFLKTLPIKEKRSGFAEAVKHAFISDPAFLQYLMTEITDLATIADDKLAYILRRGIEIKAGVVSVDERESGLRAILNFGHTLGHVIETSKGYGIFAHGEAVMVGMIYALHLSEQVTGLRFSIGDFVQWAKQLGYQTTIPDDLEFQQVYQTMLRDKKTLSDQPRFVLLEEIGKPVIVDMDQKILENTFSKLKK